MPKPRMSPDQVMAALAGAVSIPLTKAQALGGIHWCRIWHIDEDMPYQGITACGIRHNKVDGVIGHNVDPYLASDGTTIAVARKSELITCQSCLAELDDERKSPI